MVAATKKRQVKKLNKAPIKVSKPAAGGIKSTAKTDIQTFWAQEIKSLQSKSFKSYEAAVQTVLMQICERLEVPVANRKRTIERLSVVFETSELLRQSLLKHLKIKG